MDEITFTYAPYQASYMVGGINITVRGDDYKHVIDGMMDALKYYNSKYQIPEPRWSQDFDNKSIEWFPLDRLERFLGAIEKGENVDEVIKWILDNAPKYKISNDNKGAIQEAIIKYYLNK